MRSSEVASLGIVDARARPPIQAFLEDRTYTNPTRTMANVRARGWTPTTTMEEPTLDAFFAESEAAGICQVGIPARAPNKWWGGKGNDLVFEARDQHPETVFVYAAVDPSLAGAADTIADLNERGAKGIVFEPGICEVPAYLDDQMISPCYEACQAVGLPALIMGGGEAGPDISFSDPRRIDTVAGRFPDLTIVNVHGGWPYVQEAVGIAFRRQNVWMLPDVYFPGLPGEQDYLLAMQTYLQDRFLFATGYPFCPIGQTLDRILASGVPDDILTKVLRDNAVSLFELEVA